jgi:hypothetical protein
MFCRSKFRVLNGKPVIFRKNIAVSKGIPGKLQEKGFILLRAYTSRHTSIHIFIDVFREHC